MERFETFSAAAKVSYEVFDKMIENI